MYTSVAMIVTHKTLKIGRYYKQNKTNYRAQPFPPGFIVYGLLFAVVVFNVSLPFGKKVVK